jgi:hypothetical protein
VVALAVIFPFYWWLAVAREGGSGATFGRLIAGLAVVAAFLLYFGQDALGAFYGRAFGGNGEDVASRLFSPLLSPFEVLPQAGLIGVGIGATHQTAMIVTPGIVPYSWLNGMVSEIETGRIVVEIGAVGFVLIYFIRIFLILFSLRQVFRLRTRFHRSLATAAFLFASSQILGGAIFDVTSGVYYWFFPALLLAAMKLDQQIKPAAVRAPAFPVTTAPLSARSAASPLRSVARSAAP